MFGQKGSWKMEIKEQSLVCFPHPSPTPITHNFECFQMAGREGVLGPKAGVGRGREGAA